MRDSSDFLRGAVGARVAEDLGRGALAQVRLEVAPAAFSVAHALARRAHGQDAPERAALREALGHRERVARHARRIEQRGHGDAGPDRLAALPDVALLGA